MRKKSYQFKKISARKLKPSEKCKFNITDWYMNAINEKTESMS